MSRAVLVALAWASLAPPRAAAPADLSDAAFADALAADFDAFAAAWTPAPSPAPPARGALAVTWAAPFFSGGGYCSEATAFLQGLATARPPVRVAAAQHGDSASAAYARGLPPATAALLAAAADAGAPPAVAVCHSEPGAWELPRAGLRARYASGPRACPDARARAVVARTMFESDRLPEGWAARLNAVDEVWVPTAFWARVALAGGVARARLRVVPEPVDADFFSRAAAAAAPGPPPLPPRAPGVARFLSVGKFERRKGFDVLLAAFASAFFEGAGGGADGRAPRAELFILTSAYHSPDDFERAVRRELDAAVCAAGEAAGGAAAAAADAAAGAGAPPPRLCVRAAAAAAAAARVHVLRDVPQASMAAVYAGVDALVQPSRGEGWGRPAAEAMAVGVAVVQTLWSGASAFLDASVGFPLNHTHLAPVPDGAFAGHLMAEPDARALAATLRAIAADPAAARARGDAARARVRAKFSLALVGDYTARELHRVAAAADGRGEL